MLHYDSTGKVINIGNTVKFRGYFYTISKFIEGRGRLGTAVIIFVEPQHTSEIADELSVDLI